MVSSISSSLAVFRSLIPSFSSGIKKNLPNSSWEHSTIQSIKNVQTKSLSSLSLSTENQERIFLLIKQLDEFSLMELTRHVNQLQNIGALLRKEVHPLRFLHTIVTDPKTKEHLVNVYKRKNDLFLGRVWGDFIWNIGKDLEAKNDTKEYLMSFAKEVKANPHTLAFYESSRDWERFITVLLEDQVAETHLQ